MAHEILAVKLCELEDQFARLSSRIHLSERADPQRLRQEILALHRECDETELTLRAKLCCSRSEIAPILANSYGEVEQSIQRAGTALQRHTLACGSPDAAAEEKILLAEYALDFALQGANRALLLAMEAIDAQYTGQEGDRQSL